MSCILRVNHLTNRVAWTVVVQGERPLELGCSAGGDELVVGLRVGLHSHHCHHAASTLVHGAHLVLLSRAPRAVPLIGLGGARANGMMAARAVVHGFCARSGAVLCHDGSA